MRKELIKLQNNILLTSSKDNIICVLIYGSILNDDYIANDLDAIIVVKKVDSTLKDIFILFSNTFKKLDIHIYSQDEISKGISFYTREFILEYLSKDGICIFGENIFKYEFSKINYFQYRESMLIRAVERLQMVRKKYFLSTDNNDEKIKYINKYFLRLAKNILILERIHF